MARSASDDLEGRVAALEQQMKMVLRALGEETQDREIVAALAKMTPRMHGAMQMVIAGEGNLEIARRFNVSEPTAKVYVRSIAQKLGVKTRSEIVAKVLPTLRAMSDGEYRKLTKIDRHWYEHGEIWHEREHTGTGEE